MRIFALNTFCTGSTGRIALDIADYAARQGDETVLGFGAGPVPPRAAVYALRIGGPVERKVHGALRKLLDREGYGSVFATLKLIDFLKQYRPDVIHLHNLHGCYVNHRLLFHYLSRAHVPVVWTLHDCWAFTGHCAYFDYAGCEQWQTGCAHCPQKNAYPQCTGFSGSARNYRRRRELFTAVPNLTLVTPCVWLKDKLAASFLSSQPARVIHNGVNRGDFAPTQGDIRGTHGITAPYIVLAAASEWEPRKGLAYLPALADTLGRDYQVAVLGLTPEQIVGLPPNILGLPRTSSTAEMARWYTAADCFVNPTLEDNMPMVNLEALACGTPVATFATGGCPETVDDTCGAVVTKGDGQSLADAVRQLAQHKPALSEACVARAETFDSALCAEAYHTLYREICQ